MSSSVLSAKTNLMKNKERFIFFIKKCRWIGNLKIIFFCYITLHGSSFYWPLATPPPFERKRCAKFALSLWFHSPQPPRPSITTISRVWYVISRVFITEFPIKDSTKNGTFQQQSRICGVSSSAARYFETPQSENSRSRTKSARLSSSRGDFV